MLATRALSYRERRVDYEEAVVAGRHWIAEHGRCPEPA
jgi:hypothetical protein